MIYIKKKLLNRNTFYLILFLCFFMFSSQMSHAQVTIGSDSAPDANALLDLKQDGVTKGGLLLPRIALVQTSSPNPMSAHVQGMTVYNTATAGDVTPGFYYNNGTKWMKLFSAEDSFFYMPSIVLPTDEADPAFAGGVFTVNLYNNYKQQFALTATNLVKSEAAARLPVYNSNELYYFVTYYDDTVFDNVNITTAGVLTYKLKAGFTKTEKTFMNIIFKVK